MITENVKDQFSERLNFFGNFIHRQFWISRSGITLEGFFLGSFFGKDDVFNKKRFIEILRRDAFDEDSYITMKITEFKNAQLL